MEKGRIFVKVLTLLTLLAVLLPVTQRKKQRLPKNALTTIGIGIGTKYHRSRVVKVPGHPPIALTSKLRLIINF